MSNFKITAFRRPDADSTRTPDPAGILAVVSAAYSIEPALAPTSVRRLDTPAGSTAPPRVVELLFSTAGTTGAPFTLHEFRRRDDGVLDSVEANAGYDLVFQPAPPESSSRTPPRLAVFDMDSTLIRQEVIDLLAAHAGVEARVSAITARAMNGELDFEASLRARVGLLAGLSVDVFDKLKPQLQLSEGAAGLLRALKRLGARTALLSGGFLPLARHVAGLLSIDDVHANSLEVDGESKQLTGQLEPGAEIVHAERKRELLVSISQAHDITIDQTMTVGDGANDLPMLHAAGLGVAVHAKARVQREAPTRLNSATLTDLLYLFGYDCSEITELTR